MKDRWKKFTALSRLGLIYISPVTARTLDSIAQLTRMRFPEVRHISTTSLAEWLADIGRPAPLLVDARSDPEFAVSHLKDAKNCQTIGHVASVAATHSRAIVVYCSLGYRSSALAGKLLRAGYTSVFNLEGSLFAWANEGRPVFRGNQLLHPTRVHPYNDKWGKMLDPRLRAER